MAQHSIESVAIAGFALSYSLVESISKQALMPDEELHKLVLTAYRMASHEGARAILREHFPDTPFGKLAS